MATNAQQDIGLLEDSIPSVGVSNILYEAKVEFLAGGFNCH